jgi:cytochrome c
MQDLINFIQNEVKLTEFIGIRHERANGITNASVKGDEPKDDSREAAALLAQLNKMSYKELKAYAGVKGNIKREKIYQLIHLSK